MKVLVVITTDFVSWGGLTSVMMNYYRAMDRTNISFDFVSGNEPDKSCSRNRKGRIDLHV